MEFFLIWKNLGYKLMYFPPVEYGKCMYFLCYFYEPFCKSRGDYSISSILDWPMLLILFVCLVFLKKINCTGSNLFMNMFIDFVLQIILSHLTLYYAETDLQKVVRHCHMEHHPPSVASGGCSLIHVCFASRDLEGIQAWGWCEQHLRLK